MSKHLYYQNANVPDGKFLCALSPQNSQVVTSCHVRITRTNCSTGTARPPYTSNYYLNGQAITSLAHSSDKLSVWPLFVILNDISNLSHWDKMRFPFVLTLSTQFILVSFVCICFALHVSEISLEEQSQSCMMSWQCVENKRLHDGLLEIFFFTSKTWQWEKLLQIRVRLYCLGWLLWARPHSTWKVPVESS